jgi:hypothetical protein
VSSRIIEYRFVGGCPLSEAGEVVSAAKHDDNNHIALWIKERQGSFEFFKRCFLVVWSFEFSNIHN